MRIASPRLRRLDEALAALAAESDVMLLSELDGYLAGVIVCPEPILPSAWMPLVWSSEGGGTAFEDEREAQWYISLVMEHYDAIVRGLNARPDRYAPFFEHDRRHDEILWELWVEGFDAGMKLAPDSWDRITVSGEEGPVAALAGMKMPVEIACDESDLPRGTIDALTGEAPELIARWFPELHHWRRAHGDPAVPAATSQTSVKVGRNDPCPCGSGKKYKKCCGLG